MSASVPTPKSITGQKPLAFRVTCDQNFSAVAKIGARIIGWAVPSHPVDGAFFIGGSRVHEKYRRCGVATALYRAVEQAAGRPLQPSGSLSEEAFAFWCSFRPEAVANDLRHRKAELLGKSVVHRQQLAVIETVGSGSVVAVYGGAEDGGLQRRLYLVRSELPEALKAGRAAAALQVVRDASDVRVPMASIVVTAKSTGIRP